MENDKLLEALNRLSESQNTVKLELKLEMARVVETLKHTEKQLYEMSSKSNFYAKREDIEALKADFKSQLTPLADKRDLVDAKEKMKSLEDNMKEQSLKIEQVNKQASTNEKSIIKITTFGGVLLLLITVASNLGRIMQMFS